jgi:hypothetical protein
VQRFRLRSALVAVDREPGLRIVTITAGATVEVTGPVQRSGLVDVIAGGKTFSVFMRDLEESGERIMSAKA